MKNKKQLGMVILAVIACIIVIIFTINNAKKDLKSQSGTTTNEQTTTEDTGDKNENIDSSEESTQNSGDEMTTISPNENTDSKKTDSVKNENNPHENDSSNDFQNDFVDLPYAIGDTGLVVKKIGSYSGIYVEDGTNDEVKNVLTITVENTSDKTVEYSDFSFEISNGKTAEFKATLLPPGEKAILFEQKRLKYKKSHEYKFVDEITAYMDNEKLTLMEDKVSIVAANENTLTVTNLTDKDIDVLRIFYKYQYEDGTFVGGITFTSKLENIEANATITVSPAHFEAEGCKILRVEEYTE